MLTRTNERIFQVAVSVLLLVDGVIHLSLEWILFRGNLIGSLSAPGRPARPNPFILPLNQLFLMYFVGAIVLVVLFWTLQRRLGERRWWMNVVLMVYEAMAIGGWLSYGRPNPMGLGYLAKAIEIVVIITLFVYSWLIVRAGRRVAST